ncbi:MAG: hypothetical protein ACI9HK_006231, partial [Pirellulaceae bacterium]
VTFPSSVMGFQFTYRRPVPIDEELEVVREFASTSLPSLFSQIRIPRK